jgi:hypothetical protein
MQLKHPCRSFNNLALFHPHSPQRFLWRPQLLTRTSSLP